MLNYNDIESCKMILEYVLLNGWCIRENLLSVVVMHVCKRDIPNNIPIREYLAKSRILHSQVNECVNWLLENGYLQIMVTEFSCFIAEDIYQFLILSPKGGQAVRFGNKERNEQFVIFNFPL